MSLYETPTIDKREFTPLPHNIEAEQAVLGAVLIDNRLLDRADNLDPSHFWDTLHAEIWREITRTIQAGRSATPITLRNTFEQFPAIAEDMTVPRYLGRLAVNAPSLVNIQAYVRVIIDLAQRRKLIVVGEDLAIRSREAPIDTSAETLLVEAERSLYEVATQRVDVRQLSLGAATAEAIDIVSKAYERGGGLCGLSTGLIDLDKVLGGLQASDLIVIGGRPSMGKAQPLDAPVKTINGWKPIGDLRMGDQLASIDGRPSMVSGIYPQGSKSIMRVTFSDGRTTECCPEHLWLVHHRKWLTPKVLATSEVTELLRKPSMRRRMWIDLPSGDFGTDQRLPIDPWLLGAMIGNGNILTGTPLFSTASSHALATLKMAVGDGLNVVKANGLYDYRVINAAGRFQAGVRGAIPNPLTSVFKAMGLHGLKSEEKFIPQSYMLASRTVRVALLRGLFDTDGWVEKHGTVRFGTSSPQLAMDVQSLVRSIGGICTSATKIPKFMHKGERRTGLPTHTLNIMVPNPSELFTEPYKLVRCVKSSRQQRLTFKRIEFSREAEAVCISVTHPTRLYLTNDYIATHNSSIALNIAMATARPSVLDPETDTRKAIGHVHFFSMEMSAAQLAMRLMGEVAEISADKLRRGQINEDQFRYVVDRAQGLATASLELDETGGLTLPSLAARARREKRRNNTALIVIDYLQLMSGTSKSGSSRTTEISDITMGLKALAKELDVPIIALSQLSREVEKRSDKRPQLSDLRESGSIEQDADVVMMCYREEYYLERAEPTQGTSEHVEWQAKMQSVIGKAEVIVAKQRHGPVGIVPLSFNGQFTRFGNLSRSEGYPYAN